MTAVGELPVTRRSALGFRSLYRTHDVPDLIDLAHGRLVRWLEHKKYHPARMVDGASVEIGNGVWAATQRFVDDESGASTFRARIIERQPRGRWTTELTIQNSAGGSRGWVWLDVHKPDEGWTNTPRLARMLVAKVPARDGAHLLSVRPKVTDDVDEVLRVLEDPSRRGVAFVAGAAPGRPMNDWRQEVEDLLQDTAGIAHSWVLSPTATIRFHKAVGTAHAVRPGFLRTFQPKIEWGDRLDADRHRFLTPTTIRRVSAPALRRVLGQRAREQLISARLPDYLRDLDRILRRQSDEALLSGLLTPGLAEAPAHSPVVTPPAPRPAPPARRDPTSTKPTVAPEPTRLSNVQEPKETAHPWAATTTVPEVPAARTPPEQVVEPELMPHLTALIADLLGTDELSVANLARIGSMARSSRMAQERIGERLGHLRESLDEAEFERDLAREELSIEQRERAAAEDERADAERRLRYLQRELASLGKPETAWGEPELDIRDIRPDSFLDLMSRLEDLARVEFTGEVQVVTDLDRHGNPGTWAGKAWDALLALDDYARVRTEEAFQGDVAHYMAETPGGCRGFSLARHAVGESESVRQNRRLRKHRELPVPTEFESSGLVFMGAHFKLAQSAMISPRLHYVDGTAQSGKIYVGYIGPHLPTGES